MPSVVWRGDTAYFGELGSITVRKAMADDVGDFFPELEGQDVVEVEDVRVNPSERGKMIFAILVRAAFKKAAGRPMILQAYPFEEDFLNQKDWERAQKKLIALYETLGFRHEGSGWMVKE